MLIAAAFGTGGVVAVYDAVIGRLGPAVSIGEQARRTSDSVQVVLGAEDDVRVAVTLTAVDGRVRGRAVRRLRAGRRRVRVRVSGRPVSRVRVTVVAVDRFDVRRVTSRTVRVRR